MRSFVDTLRTLPGAHVCEAASGDALATLHALALPAGHLDLLTLANGASAFHGYFRLFGSGCAGCVDVTWWNDVETWKFAWPEPVSRYLAFGETGWGDQFAYDRELLTAGDTTVYLLDSFEMQPEVLAAQFSEFMTNEFMRQAREPYDSMTRGAMARIGPLGWNEHVTYVPSLLLGGDEDLDHLQKLDARSSMIINGDIATQSQAFPDKFPTSVVPFADDRGRPRMRIVWDE